MELNITEALDPRFVGPKPINTVEDRVLLELQDHKRLITSRKRDGHCHYFLVSLRGAVKLYTRTHFEVTSHYPHIVEELVSLTLPRPFLGALELFVSDGEKDKLCAIGAARHLKPEKLPEYFKKVRVQGMIFNSFIAGGVDISEWSHAKRFEEIHNHIAKRKVPHLRGIELLSEDLEGAEKRVLEHGWEGLVCYDSEASTRYKLDGNHSSPPRPIGMWKRKPLFEDDVYALDYVVAKEGKNLDRLKDFLIYQKDPATGQDVACGRVSLGLTFEERLKFLDRNLYPIVLQLGFDARTEAGMFRHARILRIRDDKSPEECHFPNANELQIYNGPRKRER